MLKKKREITQDQSINRIKLILQSISLFENKEFSAASMGLIATKFEKKNDIKIFILAIAIGLIVGISYVLISSTFQSQRLSRKKTNQT